jgi:antitoxin component YwqK of YwqJK toxin-antitoxin module
MQSNINQYDADGKPHGSWEVYYPNGVLHYIGEYFHGNVIGNWRVNFSNGQTSFIQTINAGKTIAFYVDYNSNGSIIKKRFYAR